MWTLPTSSSPLINQHHPSLIFHQDIHQSIHHNEDVANLSIHTDKSIPIQTYIILMRTHCPPLHPFWPVNTHPHIYSPIHHMNDTVPTSPSSVSTRRSTPWAAGCWGPKLSVMFCTCFSRTMAFSGMYNLNIFQSFSKIKLNRGSFLLVTSSGYITLIWTTG